MSISFGEFFDDEYVEFDDGGGEAPQSKQPPPAPEEEQNDVALAEDGGGGGKEGVYEEIDVSYSGMMGGDEEESAMMENSQSNLTHGFNKVIHLVVPADEGEHKEDKVAESGVVAASEAATDTLAGFQKKPPRNEM